MTLTLGHNVVQTVFVESGWGWDSNTEPELKSVPEVRLASAAAEESERRGGTRIGGIVGFLDMRNGAACARALEALQAASQGRLVGVRDRTAWDSDPAIPAPSTGATAGAMRAPTWRTGFAQLAQSGLTYDAWLDHPQLADLADLAASFPYTASGSGSSGRAPRSRAIWPKPGRVLRRVETTDAPAGGSA